MSTTRQAKVVHIRRHESDVWKLLIDVERYFQKMVVN